MKNKEEKKATDAQKNRVNQEAAKAATRCDCSTESEDCGCDCKDGAKQCQGLIRFLPNTITITALCFGLSSIRFALCGKWEYAVLCIFASALLDMCDGKVARMISQSSAFGLEMDSLSDLVCFGVAPSIVLYLSSMNFLGKVGWGICMFFTVCCALRLARFNVSHAFAKPVPLLEKRYFMGVPAPAGAIIALFPLILSFETGNGNFASSEVVGAFLIVGGALMISTLRTFSSKMVEVTSGNAWVVLTAIALVVICLTTRLWLTLSFLIAVYILLIPAGAYSYKRELEEVCEDEKEAEEVADK